MKSKSLRVVHSICGQKALEILPTQSFEVDLPGFMRSWKILNGSIKLDEELAITYTKDLYQRTSHPIGVAWNHIRCQGALGNIGDGLKANTVPALFIHGEDDQLIPIQGGIDTFVTTANARMVKDRRSIQAPAGALFPTHLIRRPLPRYRGRGKMDVFRWYFWHAVCEWDESSHPWLLSHRYQHHHRTSLI